MNRDRIAGVILGLSAGVVIGYCLKVEEQRAEGGDHTHKPVGFLNRESALSARSQAEVREPEPRPDKK